MFTRSTATRLAAAVLIATATLGITTTPSNAAANSTKDQCLVTVTGTDSNGLWTFGPQRCFSTFAEVKSAAESSTSNSAAGTTSATFGTQAIIATHYDGSNGTGASFSVSGTSCNGGGFNVSSTWNDRISSTTSSCHTVHYQNTNYAGASYTTNPGSGVNVGGGLDNQTSSIIYNP